MRAKRDNPGPALARLAGRQHGIVTRKQLYGLGVSSSGVGRRLENGQLHRIYRGVYAVGHPRPSKEGKWLAAVLACGDGAVLSHRSAAALWRLLDAKRGPIHVSVPTTSGRRQPSGIRLHRRRSLRVGHATTRMGIPVTKPAKTISDLRSAVPTAEHRRAIRQAEVRGYRTGLDGAVAHTRSELEDIFLKLCRRHRVPVPEVNVRVAGREVDFLWRRQRVVAETDGYRYHRGSVAFEDDRDRDIDLRAAGCAILRFTYRQVTSEPRRVAASIDEALRR